MKNTAFSDHKRFGKVGFQHVNQPFWLDLPKIRNSRQPEYNRPQHPPQSFQEKPGNPRPGNTRSFSHANRLDREHSRCTACLQRPRTSLNPTAHATLSLLRRAGAKAPSLSRRWTLAGRPSSLAASRIRFQVRQSPASAFGMKLHDQDFQSFSIRLEIDHFIRTPS